MEILFFLNTQVIFRIINIIQFFCRSISSQQNRILKNSPTFSAQRETKSRLRIITGNIRIIFSWENILIRIIKSTNLVISTICFRILIFNHCMTMTINHITGSLCCICIMIFLNRITTQSQINICQHCFGNPFCHTEAILSISSIIQNGRSVLQILNNLCIYFFWSRTRYKHIFQAFIRFKN